MTESKKSSPLVRIVAGLIAIALAAFGVNKLGDDEPNPADASQAESASGGSASSETQDGEGTGGESDAGGSSRDGSADGGSTGGDAAGDREPGDSDAGENSRILVEVPGVGTVDVTDTLARIDRGEKHPHRNDGSVFQNREGLLPDHPRGYYREYVHPTPGYSGPGARRLVIGNGGEIYYTHDHYESFTRVNPD